MRGCQPDNIDADLKQLIKDLGHKEIRDRDRAYKQIQDKTNRRNEAVMQAAQECLLFLKQRIEQQQISQSLLRPSDKATTAPDALLRPASPTQGTEPAQLLRAGTNVQGT